MLQTLIFGFSQGSVYALMALAIGIIYSTTRIINFCHADIVMIGAMMSYWLVQIMQLDYGLGLIIAIILNSCVGIITYLVCVKHTGTLSAGNNWMITLFGFGILLKNLARMFISDDVNVFPYLFDGKVIHIGTINILVHELVMILSAIVVGLSYEIVCKRTRFGRALRAVSYKPTTAKLMGVNSSKIIIICFAISGAIAAYAGALIAPITFVSYGMTSTIGLKGYAAALIGGLGNTAGAFIGGISLGLVECIITMFIPAGLKDAVSFVIMILVIIFLPGGLLSAKIFTRGKSKTEKV